MKPATVLSLAFAFGIGFSSAAEADLANCMVLWRCDGNVGSACQKIVSEFIYDAYAASDNSADNLVFILDMNTNLAAGEYEIDKAKLVLGGSFSLEGYRVRACDTDGLMNGVVEIKKALLDHRIFELKPGKRSRLLAAPIYAEQPVFQMEQ